MALFRAPDVKQGDVLKKVIDEAQKQVSEKKFALAKVSYSKAIHYDPRCAEAYVGRARVFEQLYKEPPQKTLFLDQAIADYSAVLLQNPHHVEALLGRALLYQKKGAAFKAQADDEMKSALQETKARKKLIDNQMLGLGTNNKDINKLVELSAVETYYAELASNDGRMSDALFHMNKGLEYFPGNYALRFFRAQHYANKQNNHQKALEDMLRCIQDCPQRDVYYVYCGMMYAELGNYEKAKEYFANGMILNSSLDDIPSGWRDQCLDIFNDEKYTTGKIDQQLIHLKKEELIAKAQIAMEKTDYSDALRILNAAIWVKINDASLYILCAEAYLALGEYKTAYQHSCIGIWLAQTKHPEYFYLRAKALSAMCDHVGARWNFDQAISSKEKNPQRIIRTVEKYAVPLTKYVIQLGVAASINDDFDRAEKYFDMAARYYTDAAKFMERLHAKYNIFTSNEIADLYLEHGIVHENRGNLNAAREEYLWAYVSYPSDERVNAKADRFAIKAVLNKLCKSSDKSSFKDKRKIFYGMAAKLGANGMKQAIGVALSEVGVTEVVRQPRVVSAAQEQRKKKRVAYRHHTPHFSARHRSHQSTSAASKSNSTKLTLAEERELVLKRAAEEKENARRAENKRNAERHRAVQVTVKASGVDPKTAFALITEETALLSVPKALPVAVEPPPLPVIPKPVAAAPPAADKKEAEKKTILLSEEEKAVLRQLKLTDPKALFTGGALRQRWLTKKRSNEKDIDIVTTATDEQILASLKEFGVVKNTHGGFSVRLSDNTKIDIYRSEHLKVSLKQDASMRDFTINALYADENGNLIDELGTSIADLSKDTLVPISEAKAFFARDACNILLSDYVSLESGKKLPADYEAEVKNHLPALAREADIRASKVNHKLMKEFFAGDIPSVFAKLLNNGVIDALFKPAGALNNDKDWIMEQLSQIFEDSPNLMLKRIYMIFLTSLTMQDPKLNEATVYNIRRNNELLNLQLTGMDNFAKHYNEMVGCWQAAGQVEDQAVPQVDAPPQSVWQYIQLMPFATNPMMQFGMWTPAPELQQVVVKPLHFFLSGYVPQSPQL